MTLKPTLTNEDLDDIKTVAEELSKLCVIKDRTNEEMEQLIYEIKSCCSAIIEFMSDPAQYSIKKMF